jgi:hypothetical protein
LAARHFIPVTHAIRVSIQHNHCTAGTNLTVARSENTRTISIGGSCVEVTGRCVLAAWNLISIAHPVSVRILNHYIATCTNLTVARRENAGTIGIRRVRVEVAGRCVLAARHFISVANAIPIGIQHNHSTAGAHFAVACGKFARSI